MRSAKCFNPEPPKPSFSHAEGNKKTLKPHLEPGLGLVLDGPNVPTTANGSCQQKGRENVRILQGTESEIAEFGFALSLAVQRAPMLGHVKAVRDRSFLKGHAKACTFQHVQLP